MKKILEQVFINSTKQDGTPMLDKTGTPFKMCNVKFQGDPNKYSMFIGQKYGQKDLEVVSGWSAGMEVDVITEQNGQYFNFKLPNKTDEIMERVNSLENFVRQICVLNGLKTKSGIDVQLSSENASNGQIEASQEITPDDIPF